MNSNTFLNSIAYGTKLTTTAATAVFTAPPDVRSRVSMIWICNTDTVTRAVTIEWYDLSATTSFRFEKSFNLAGSSSLTIEPPAMWLPSGDEIRVTAGTANTLEAIVTAEAYSGRSQ